MKCNSKVGSGAIAQVHKAEVLLRGQKVEVVIKLVHKKAREKIILDMKIISLASKFIESTVPGALWWSLSDEVRVFKGNLMLFDEQVMIIIILTFRYDDGAVGYAKRSK